MSSNFICSQRETAVEYCATSPRAEKVISNCVQSKRDMKNFESIQQSFLLGLLNKFGTFVLERPLKKSKVTFQFTKVQSLILPTETIEIGELVEEYCKSRSKNELSLGVREERVKRRFDKNRFIFLSNLLLDIAMEHGYFFETKLSRNTGGSIQLEKVRNIFFNFKFLFSQEEMMARGIALNKYIFSLTDNSDKIGKLNQNDPVITKILFDPIASVQKDWDIQLQQRSSKVKKPMVA